MGFYNAILTLVSPKIAVIIIALFMYILVLGIPLNAYINFKLMMIGNIMGESFPLEKGKIFRKMALIIGVSFIFPYISLYVYYKFHRLLEELSDYMVSIDTLVPPPVAAPSLSMSVLLTLVSGGVFLGIWLGGIISDYNSILKFYEEIGKYKEEIIE
jgi:hypothetical protein